MIKRTETFLRCQRDADILDGKIITRGGLRRFFCTFCVTTMGGVTKEQKRSFKDHSVGVGNLLTSIKEKNV